MNMINGLPYGGLQNSQFNQPSLPEGLRGAIDARITGARSNMQNGAVGQAMNQMNQATAQIASAVAQEMVAAVTQAAMPYTGQGNEFGQVKAGIGGTGFAQRATQMQEQMRASILAPQLPTRSLMPIRRP